MLNDYCLATSLIAGVAGFYIRYWISRDGSDRKEDRAKLDSIIDEIETVEELAYEYYSSPYDAEGAKKNSLQINRLMKKIGSDVYNISVLLEDVHIPKLQLGFKQKVTLNDYESSSRLSRIAKDPLFDEISDASRKLVGALEQAFRRKYRNHNNKNLSSL